MKRYSSFFILLVPILLVSIPALAQDHAPMDRILGGHVFQLPTLQRSAFVETTFGIRLAAATYSADPGNVAILEGKSLDVIRLAPELSFTARLIDWLGLELIASAPLEIGANGRSLLVRTGVFSLDAELGAVFRLLRLKSTEVSLRAFGGYTKGNSIFILPVLGTLIQQPVPTVQTVAEGNLTELLSTPSKQWSFGGGVYAAQALGRFFGLQGSFTAQRGWITESPFQPTANARVDGNSTVLSFLAAIAADVDFAPLKVPVALLAEYAFAAGHRADAIAGDVQSRISNIGLGVFYSGRDNLQLGISLALTLNGDRVRTLGAAEDFELTSTPTIKIAQLVFRYFW